MSSKFKETSAVNGNEHTVIRAYQHIDNGGHFVEVDVFGNLTVETGFFGYSHTTVLLSTIDIDGLMEILQIAKRRLEELETIRRLKGE